MTEYIGPERRVGPASRRDSPEAGRYTDRRNHRFRNAGWLRRCLRGYFGRERRKNEGRRTTPQTGLRRAADRARFDAYHAAESRL